MVPSVTTVKSVSTTPVKPSSSRSRSEMIARLKAKPTSGTATPFRVNPTGIP